MAKNEPKNMSVGTRGESWVSLFQEALCLVLKVILCLRSYFSSPPYPGPSSCTLRCWPVLHIAALSNLPNAVTSQANQPPGGTSGQAKRFQFGTMWALHVMTNKVMSLLHSLHSFSIGVSQSLRTKCPFDPRKKKNLLVIGTTRFFRWDFTHLRRGNQWTIGKWTALK